MATSKIRAVDSRFWSDSWVQSSLNPLDRYLFIYLLTNERSSWCGVYELPLKFIANETGIEKDELERSMLPRLAPKILYIDGWIAIKNFEKYHTNTSPKTQKGIEVAWSTVPERIRLKIKEIWGNEYPIQGVSSSTSTSSSTSSTTYITDCKEIFSEFWTEYPSTKRNARKEEVFRKFIKGNPSLEELTRRLNHLKEQKEKDRKWIDGYIPNMTTYFNQERWNMEIEGIRLGSKPANVLTTDHSKKLVEAMENKAKVNK